MVGRGEQILGLEFAGKGFQTWGPVSDMAVLWVS